MTKYWQLLTQYVYKTQIKVQTKIEVLKIMKYCDENPEKFERGEDATKYGEFVSSYFEWIPLEKQKQKAEELENITKGKKK